MLLHEGYESSWLSRVVEGRLRLRCGIVVYVGWMLGLSWNDPFSSFEELVITSCFVEQHLKSSSINHLQHESRRYSICSGCGLRARQRHDLLRRRQHHGQERRQ